jgi:hypothetical protein
MKLNEAGADMKNIGWAIACALVAMPATLHAQQADADVEREAPAAPTQRGMDDGVFVPLTLAPEVGSTRAFASAHAGYDGATNSAIIESAAEASLWGPVSLRGGASYSNGTQRMRPSAGGRVQVMRQGRHGIDGSIAIFYKAEGFTEAEGEIESFVSIGRRIGRLSLLGNIVYGQDPEGNERDGELRAAVLHHAGRFVLGLDTRLRFALGAQRGRAATVEPKVDLAAGPLATVAVGSLALFVEAGPRLIRFADRGTAVGISGIGGVGAAF